MLRIKNKNDRAVLNMKNIQRTHESSTSINLPLRSIYRFNQKIISIKRRHNNFKNENERLEINKSDK